MAVAPSIRQHSESEIVVVVVVVVVADVLLLQDRSFRSKNETLSSMSVCAINFPQPIVWDSLGCWDYHLIISCKTGSSNSARSSHGRPVVSSVVFCGCEKITRVGCTLVCIWMGLRLEAKNALNPDLSIWYCHNSENSKTSDSGDSWMYPYQRTPMGNPYISPIYPYIVGVYGLLSPRIPI